MSWSMVGLAASTLLASAVEFVEAFTIVLAMGLTRGWRSTLAGTASALVVLTGVAFFSGYALINWFPKSALQLVVGSLASNRCTTKRRRSVRKPTPHAARAAT
jgi:uncharacterized membrane protein